MDHLRIQVTLLPSYSTRLCTKALVADIAGPSSDKIEVTTWHVVHLFGLDWLSWAK